MIPVMFGSSLDAWVFNLHIELVKSLGSPHRAAHRAAHGGLALEFWGDREAAGSPLGSPSGPNAATDGWLMVTGT